MKRLLILLALVLAGCAKQHDAPVRAHPALWRATNGATTYWLLGTMHLLPKDTSWRSRAIDGAIHDSDTLILEIPPGDPKAAAASFLRVARADGLPPVADRIPRDRRHAYDKAVVAAGTTKPMLDRMQSWAAALTLTTGATRDIGANDAHGVEATLEKQFAGKHRAALETLDGQLAMFAALPEYAQRILLAQSIEDAADAQASYRATLDAWASGDQARIEASFDPSLREAPQLEEMLVTQRNRHWADLLAARKGGTALIAVGAGHMIGRNGLPALLNVRGFRVARVQ